MFRTSLYDFLFFFNLGLILKWLVICVQIIYNWSACKSLKVNIFPRRSNSLPLIIFALKSLTMSSNALRETVVFELCSKDNSLLAGSFWECLNHSEYVSKWRTIAFESMLKALSRCFFPTETNAVFKRKVWSGVETERSPFPEFTPSSCNWL